MIRRIVCVFSLVLAAGTRAGAQDAAPPTPAPPAVTAPSACDDDQPFCELSQLVIKPGAPGTGLRTFRANPGIVVNGLRPIDRNALRLPKASVGMVPAR